MSVKKITVLVLAALVMGLVLGGIGIANGAGPAAKSPTVQACPQGLCDPAACPGGAAQCDQSQCGTAACPMGGAASPCGSGGCDMGGAASVAAACAGGACSPGQ